MTPVNPVVLAKALQGYDPEKASFVINGFTFGFEFHFNGTASSKTCKNLISAKEMPEVVNQKHDKEIKAGRIAGLFVKPPFDSFQVSPLVIVPKKHPNKFRLIHHLSYPEGNSINFTSGCARARRWKL